MHKKLYRELHRKLHLGMHFRLHRKLHVQLYLELHGRLHKELHPGNESLTMKINPKNRLYCALFLILLGTILCTSVYAAGPTADELRKRAATLEQKVSLCEKDLAQGAKDCLVIVNWEGNRKVSMAEARTLASRYLAEARQLDTASAPNVLPGWRPDELSNPQISKIARSLDSIKVPPPIPSTEASIDWGKAAVHAAGGVDYGMLALDIVGKIGSKHLVLKGIVIATKTFIAGEDEALVFATKRNETYEKALKYLKDPATAKAFAYLVKELKEKGESSSTADQEMIKAARAIADPALTSVTKLVWDAMFSPDARTAMVKKACLEVGSELVSTGAAGALSKLSPDLEVRKGVFDAIRLERSKAVNMMKYVSPDSSQAYELNRVIAHANKQLELTYRTEQAGPKIMGFMAGQYAYKEAEK